MCFIVAIEEAAAQDQHPATDADTAPLVDNSKAVVSEVTDLLNRIAAKHQLKHRISSDFLSEEEARRASVQIYPILTSLIPSAEIAETPSANAEKSEVVGVIPNQSIQLGKAVTLTIVARDDDGHIREVQLL